MLLTSVDHMQGGSEKSPRTLWTLSAGGAPAPLWHCQLGAGVSGTTGTGRGAILDVSSVQQRLRRQPELTRQRATSLQLNNWVLLQNFHNQQKQGHALQQDSPSCAWKLQVTQDDSCFKLLHLFVLPWQAAGAQIRRTGRKTERGNLETRKLKHRPPKTKWSFPVC